MGTVGCVCLLVVACGGDGGHRYCWGKGISKLGSNGTKATGVVVALLRSS